MTEAVYNVDSIETLNALAQTMQFWDQDAQSVKWLGPIGDESSSASYFLTKPEIVYQPTGETIVVEGMETPAMAPLSGLWGRLRLNGESNFLTQLKAVVAATEAPLTIYEWNEALGAWSADGVTPAPDYIGSIALIA